MDQNDQFIQGTWNFVNESGNERSGPAHLFNQWAFIGGNFDYIYQVGAPQTLYGKYRILESGEDQILLELYDINGTQQHSPTQQLMIRIDRENDQIRVGRILYERVAP